MGLRYVPAAPKPAQPLKREVEPEAWNFWIHLSADGSNTIHYGVFSTEDALKRLEKVWDEFIGGKLDLRHDGLPLVPKTDYFDVVCMPTNYTRIHYVFYFGLSTAQLSKNKNKNSPFYYNYLAQSVNQDLNYDLLFDCEKMVKERIEDLNEYEDGAF